MRGFRKASPMLSKGSASQLQYNPLKKLPEVDQQHHQQQQQEQQQPLLQTLSTPQKYRVSPMDLMRPVKTKAETVSVSRGFRLDCFVNGRQETNGSRL